VQRRERRLTRVCIELHHTARRHESVAPGPEGDDLSGVIAEHSYGVWAVKRAGVIRPLCAGELRRGERISCPARYLTSESILNIGRYIAMMITPTIKPTPIIMIGSMMLVSVSIDASTSSS